MKHNCENIEIIRSDGNVESIIYNIFDKYYSSLGYYFYQKAWFIGRCVGIKKDCSWVYDMIFNPEPTVCMYMYIDIDDAGLHTISVEHRSKEMLSTSKGLCQALNQAMPEDIIWDIKFLDDTDVI